MLTVHLDIETYCDISLPDVGVYKYASHPSFKILLLAYAIDDGPVEIIDLEHGEKLPDTLVDMLNDTDITKAAHNAQFERVCLSCAGYTSKAYIDPTGWRCTMIQALSLGLPASLRDVAKTLGFTEDKQKLTTGKNLIRLFSLPRNPSEANGYQISFTGEDKPSEWDMFKEYCIQDVVVERDIYDTLSRFDPNEDDLWHLDQRINDRGIAIDTYFVKNAVSIDEAYQYRLYQRYQAVTGLDNPKSVAQLKIWLNEELGIDVPKITKETLPGLVQTARDQNKQAAIEALKIRQETAKTSTKKYSKMLDVVMDDSRARGLLQFCGAGRTGRWAGRLIQVQNLPQNHISDLDTARQIVASGDLDTLEMVYDKVPNILSQLIRTAFVPTKGKKFVVADFSAIEARIIAWLSGEAWRMGVFNSHGKIYEASAAQMFKVPIETIDKGSPLRQKGKVAELALGYQGGPGALISMGALKMGVKEEELPQLVDQWRKSNPNIVNLWKTCENAAKQAVDGELEIQIDKNVRFIKVPEYLFVVLPSGRKLAYRDARLDDDKYGSKITYMGQNQTTNRWERQDTYGGKLVENIIQAIARDCLAVALLRIDQAGYRIVMHVHDEVVIEVDKDDDKSLKRINAIMGKPIDWAKDLPLRADGYECNYYQKD